jgi:hypothetical protein
MAFAVNFQGVLSAVFWAYIYIYMYIHMYSQDSESLQARLLISCIDNTVGYVWK